MQHPKIPTQQNATKRNIVNFSHCGGGLVVAGHRERAERQEWRLRLRLLFFCWGCKNRRVLKINFELRGYFHFQSGVRKLATFMLLTRGACVMQLLQSSGK